MQRAKNIVDLTFRSYRKDGERYPAYARYAADLGNNFLSNTWRVSSEADWQHALVRSAEGMGNPRDLQYLRRILARAMAASSAQERSSLAPHRITSWLDRNRDWKSSVQMTWELEVAEGMLWPVKRSNQLGPSSSSSPGPLEMRDFVPQCGTSWFRLGRKKQDRYPADPLTAHPPLLQRRPVPTSPSLTPKQGASTP